MDSNSVKHVSLSDVATTIMSQKYLTLAKVFAWKTFMPTHVRDMQSLQDALYLILTMFIFPKLFVRICPMLKYPIVQQTCD